MLQYTDIGCHLNKKGIKRLNEYFDILDAKKKQQVYALDGVFLAVKKDVFDAMKFSSSLSGFHGYDLDFTLRVAQKKKNFFVPDILIEHFSNGNIDKSWVENNILIRERIGSNFTTKRDFQTEIKAYQSFLFYFFKYYEFNYKNFQRTFQFMPNNLSIIEKIKLFLTYRFYLNNKIKSI